MGLVTANSAKVVYITISEPLEPGQDYLFEPRAHPTLATTSAPVGAGLSTGIFEHNQSKVLFTNFAETEVTIFKGTTIGYASSLPAAAPHVLWMEAGDELSAFWGLDKQQAGQQEGADLGAASRAGDPGEVPKVATERRDWGVAPVVSKEKGVSSHEPPR